MENLFEGLSDSDKDQLNQFSGLLNFKYTWPYKKFLFSKTRITLLSTGNQFGKTGSVARSYVDRIMGFHPIAERNVVYFECNPHVCRDLDCEECKTNHTLAPFKVPPDGNCPTCGKQLVKHERSSRVIRFCSETLPGQSHNTNDTGKSAEVKNTQYPEFKKWLPPFLIKKDISFRISSMIIRDIYGGDDIIVEFVSYNQSTQSVAGQQRMSIWCDESPDYDFYQEQLPRLVAENGDMVFTYTPVDVSSWLFDEFYDKAKNYYRTKAVVDYLASRGDKAARVELNKSDEDITVIQAATDDNPTLSLSAIGELFRSIDDPDTLAIRRYGIFKQLSGRIFKDFSYNIHFVKESTYFPDGIPQEWTHVRGIDYHPQTPWAVGFLVMSPTNEVFVWNELSISPERYTTREIAHEIALRSGKYKFRLSKIDPLSEATAKDKSTVKTDLNADFRELAKDGICSGGYWTSWDTKGERGRDVIRERLKNAKECKRPFNNRVMKDGLTTYLPTLWILDSCKQIADSMKNWRWEEWADSSSLLTKDKKNKPEQKWSHFNMVLEALFKEAGFRPPITEEVGDRNRFNYFNNRR